MAKNYCNRCTAAANGTEATCFEPKPLSCGRIKSGALTARPQRNFEDREPTASTTAYLYPRVTPVHISGMPSATRALQSPRLCVEDSPLFLSLQEHLARKRCCSPGSQEGRVYSYQRKERQSCFWDTRRRALRGYHARPFVGSHDERGHALGAIGHFLRPFRGIYCQKLTESLEH